MSTPPLLTLYHYGSTADLPDLSPFCIKLETWLRLSQIPYERRLGNPFKAPHGKLPYIRIDGQYMADSTLIIKHLEAKGHATLDQGLSAQQRASARAWQSLLEEHLYFALVRQRWQRPQGWAIYAPLIGQVIGAAGAPKALMPLILPSTRKKALKNLQGQGFGRLTDEGADALSVELIEALATHLESTPFMLGDTPHGIDASAYGMLLGLQRLVIPGALNDAFQAHPALSQYCDKLSALAWP